MPKSKQAEFVSVLVPVPRFIVLEFALLDDKIPAVKLYVTRLKEPFVMVNVNDDMLRALPKLQEQSTPFTVIALDSPTPFVVNVSPVELLDSVMAPV